MSHLPYYFGSHSERQPMSRYTAERLFRILGLDVKEFWEWVETQKPLYKFGDDYTLEWIAMKLAEKGQSGD